MNRADYLIREREVFIADRTMIVCSVTGNKWKTVYACTYI